MKKQNQINQQKHKCRHSRPGQPRRAPIVDMVIGSGSIRVPRAPLCAQAAVGVGESCVKIPLDEYTGLVVNSTMLRIIRRMVEADSSGYYIRNHALRVVLGMPDADDKTRK